VLVAAYDRLWALQSATRLLSSDPLRADSLRSASRRFLREAMGLDARDPAAQNDIDGDLEAQLTQTYASVDGIITAALAAHTVSGDS